MPVEIAARKETIVVAKDEEPQRFNEQKLRALRPAFDAAGTVTAGNASSLNDGAAAVVVLSADRAAELGVRPQARILGYATFSREPEWFTLAPIGAIRRLMECLKLTVGDVDLFEINEAFSVVPLAAMKELGLPHEKVNVHGGARRPGTSHRRQRRPHPGHLAARAGAAPREGGHRLAVHRRRRGGGPGGPPRRLSRPRGAF